MLPNITDLVRNDNFEEVQTFIRNTKEAKGDRWFTGGDPITDACRDAILLKRERIVQLFLDEGLDPDVYAHKDGEGACCCPLKYFAARVGSLNIVKELVRRGAKIKDDDRCYAMRGAIKGGHEAVVQFLLESGGDSNGVFEGVHRQTCLGRAAFDGRKCIVNLLVQYGAKTKLALSLNDDNFRKPYRHYEAKISRYNDDARAFEMSYSSEAEMKKWDQEKRDLIAARDHLLQQYSNSVKMLLDHAIGINFDKEIDDLNFLNDLDITGFNFVGVSIDGQPITREMLVEKGFKGADKAIVTRDDISTIEDQERQDALIAQLKAKLQSQGKIISEHGVVNLVPLPDAAKKGLLEVVQVRLSAGIDPNQVITDESNSRCAIVAAANNGFIDVVRLLAEHPNIDKKTRLEASKEAHTKGHVTIADYLDSLVDVTETDHNGNALIHHAANAKDTNRIGQLLSGGANINLENGEGKTPLAIAASNAGNIKWGRKASEKDIALLKFLLANHADPNQYRFVSPLASAAASGSSEAVALLLPGTEKRDLKETKGYGRDKKEITIPWYVPLMFDSYGSEEWLQILSLLKEHGADLNAKNECGETLLHQLIGKFPSFTKIRKVMGGFQQAIAGCEDRLGQNPLQKEYEIRIEKSRKSFEVSLKVLNFLLENGADPKVPCGDNEETALHVLIKKNRFGIY